MRMSVSGGDRRCSPSADMLSPGQKVSSPSAVTVLQGCHACFSFPYHFPFLMNPEKTTCRDGSVTKQHDNTSNKNLSWISAIWFFLFRFVLVFLKPGAVVHAYNPRARDQEQADPWGLLVSQLDLIREALSKKNKDGG